MDKSLPLHCPVKPIGISNCQKPFTRSCQITSLEPWTLRTFVDKLVQYHCRLFVAVSGESLLSEPLLTLGFDDVTQLCSRGCTLRQPGLALVLEAQTSPAEV